VAKTGEGSGSEGFESANFVVFDPVNTGVGIMAGIEQAAEFRVEVDVGVQFVQDSRRLMACHEAKEDGGSEVIGAKDFGTEGGHVIEDGGFTAAGVDGSEIEAWGLGESFNDMGMSGPEGEDNGSARREVKVEEGAVMDLVEESGRVEDGLGPGFDEGEADFFGFGVIIADAGGFDGVIECAETEAEAFGFVAADELVVDFGELGETG